MENNQRNFSRISVVIDQVVTHENNQNFHFLVEIIKHKHTIPTTLKEIKMSDKRKTISFR